MTADEIVAELHTLGSEQYKRILLNHGIKEPLLGVKIEYLKKIRRRVKHDHALSLALFDTGIYDAMYLAGLIADAEAMTKKDLRRWLARSTSAALCGSIVPAVAAESRHGWELALEWIESKKELVATTGWTTLSRLVSIRDDDALELKQLKQLLARAGRTIHQQPNHVRYAMNGFVIAAGCFVPTLTDYALQVAEKIGAVSVDFGRTACQVPYAPDYIRKVQTRGTVGKKRKSARC